MPTLTKPIGNADLRPTSREPQGRPDVATTTAPRQRGRVPQQAFQAPLDERERASVRIMGSDRSAPSTSQPGKPQVP